jgi:hypothetical protein
LNEISAPKFWPKETFEPILAQYETDHSVRRNGRRRFARLVKFALALCLSYLAIGLLSRDIYLHGTDFGANSGHRTWA